MHGSELFCVNFEPEVSPEISRANKMLKRVDVFLFITLATRSRSLQ